MKTRTKEAYMRDGVVYLPDGTEYQFTKANRDVNGNSRYIVSFHALGLKSHESTPVTRRAGLHKYMGKDYGGGFIFQSANPVRSAESFHALGLHRPIDKATDMIAAMATIDKAIKDALTHPSRTTGPAYVLQSLASAMRELKYGPPASRRVKIKQLEALANII